MLKNNDCIFCSLSSDRIIAENEYAYAILDNYPVTEFHTLVIPKRHAVDYFDLTHDEVIACDALLREKRVTLLEKDSSIEGFNIGANAGEAAGQTVMHCHIHLIPRRKGDMNDPKGGVRGVIPEKQKY